MQHDTAFALLAQSTVARALQVFRDTERDVDVDGLINELASYDWTARVAEALRGLPPEALEQLLLEAAGRVQALDALAECDAELDALKRRSEHASDRYRAIECAAHSLSLALRQAAPVDVYVHATYGASRALSQHTETHRQP